MRDPAGSQDLDLSQLDRLLGDVELEEEIARTERAAVFRIRAGRGGTGASSLALKVGLHPGGTEDLARFRHEMRLLSETRHPNVVEVYGFGVLPGGFPFLTMELLAAPGIAGRLRAAGWDAFYDAAIQAAAGLAHLHRQGIVHLDLKPASLGLAPEDPGLRLKILGFGLAQETRALLGRRIRGTLAYTAPEVLLQGSCDHRADLYSLGMILFELATGVLPSADAGVPDPLALRPDMPPPLAQILLRLVRRDPGERCASAGRLLLDLAAAAGRPVGAAEAAAEAAGEQAEPLRSEALSTHSLGSLIGRSRVISDLKQMLERVAQGTSTVLVRGESGTGKGMVARILHAASPRRQAPFIHFNCAALPETLVESELFGHEKGAFTGATGTKPGRFELAHQGTIFLDEIGKVSPAVQAKLLRVVEEKEFERVGGTKTLRADVRILAATNLDLEAAITRNEFREDLFYRLNIIPIVLPPLRERREDIPYLVEHFLAKVSRDQGRPPKELDPAVLGLFAAYAWPGNVRELEAAIHRAFVLSGDGDTLTVDDFGWIALGNLRAAAPRPPEDPGSSPALLLGGGGYEAALDRYDRQLILAGLAQCNGKIRETARLLGIARNTLRAKMKKYGLQAAGE